MLAFYSQFLAWPAGAENLFYPSYSLFHHLSYKDCMKLAAIWEAGNWTEPTRSVLNRHELLGEDN